MINFPATAGQPTDGSFTYTYGDQTWYWDGTAWLGSPVGSAGTAYVKKAGDTMTGPLAMPLGSAAVPSLTFSGNTNTGLWSPAADTLAISTGGTQLLTGTPTGEVLVGLPESRSVGIPRLFQVEGLTNKACLSVITNWNAVGTGGLVIGKTRSSVTGGVTAVQSNDQLGSIAFFGADGSALNKAAGSISCLADPGPTVAAGAFVVGIPYKIAVVGTTNFTLIGASANTVGTIFTATGAGSGTGTATTEPHSGSMPGRLVLSTTDPDTTSPREVLRVTNDRYLRLNTGTGGIQFGGDTAAANALDDYEEGTFVPTIVGSTTAGVGTYTIQTGFYTKIGNLVNFTIHTNWSAHTGAGNMSVAGLPFVSSSSANIRFAVAPYPSAIALTADFVLFLTIVGSSSEILVIQTPIGGVAGVTGNVPIDTVGAIICSGAYRVA